jgi:hypothetical protein
VYSTLLFSPLLLKRRRWTGILRWGILGYVLPRLPFLWCYGVFRCSVSLRVIIVPRDIIYVIIILYSWHLVICDYFWSYVWNNWSWVMYTMSTWFWHKNRVWQLTLAATTPWLKDILNITVAQQMESPLQRRAEASISSLWDTSSNQLSHIPNTIFFESILMSCSYFLLSTFVASISSIPCHAQQWSMPHLML